MRLRSICRGGRGGARRVRARGHFAGTGFRGKDFWGGRIVLVSGAAGGAGGRAWLAGVVGRRAGTVRGPARGVS